jgi:penicillin-binding protein 2
MMPHRTHSTIASRAAWFVGMLGEWVRPAVTLCGFGVGLLAAQTAPAPADSAVNDASIKGLKNARVISLAIPAPRGQILDREGRPFAQSRVCFKAALQFPQFENATREFVLEWAQKRLSEMKVLFPRSKDYSDASLWSHYQDRRWLPLYLSHELSSAEAAKLTEKWGKRDDLIMVPVYARFYPGASLACHVIGYTGSAGKLPTGPINYNDPLWEHAEGKAGLELLYNGQLAGTPGMKRILYNNDGVKLQEEIVKRPIAGGNVVTTLNKRWQEHAESVLRDGCQRGAMVVIDVSTGEVLVMASRPGFDLMEFVGGISSQRFRELNEDPAAPLFARSFSAQYPPASTFKAVVGLAAMEANTVNESTMIYSPAFLEFPGHKIRNATGKAEGSIDIKRAMARSCNTWFAQVGMQTGPSTLMATARKLGYGDKTGLPLIGEAPGLMPTNEWMLQYHKRRFMGGDTANMSIGQGVLLATPLQVAQGMAGIAHGQALPKLQLIHQVQDGRGRVVSQGTLAVRHELAFSDPGLRAVRDGMRDVVNAPYGTGQSARLDWTTLCGKTGTAQWGPPSKNQRLAWFAGFLPADHPRYAYAVVYEGKPGQVVSGGRMAAPMVKAFFQPLRKEIEEVIAPPQKAMVIDENAVDATLIAPEAIRAIPVLPEDDEEMGVPRAVPIDESPEVVDPSAMEPPTAPLIAQPVEEDDATESMEPASEVDAAESEIQVSPGNIRRAIPVPEEEEVEEELKVLPD